MLAGFGFILYQTRSEFEGPWANPDDDDDEDDDDPDDDEDDEDDDGDDDNDDDDDDDDGDDEADNHNDSFWGNGLAVERSSWNPEGLGSNPRLGSHRSSHISIEHAEFLRSTPSLLMCRA